MIQMFERSPKLWNGVLVFSKTMAKHYQKAMKIINSANKDSSIIQEKPENFNNEKQSTALNGKLDQSMRRSRAGWIKARDETSQFDANLGQLEEFSAHRTYCLDYPRNAVEVANEINLLPTNPMSVRYQSLDRAPTVVDHDREFLPIRDRRDRSLERGLYFEDDPYM
ncbi:hypothetical protein YQE_05426, partial [Dendroctonus ponderosae]